MLVTYEDDDYFPYDVTMFWEFFRWERYKLGHIYLQCFKNGKLYAGQSIQIIGRMREYRNGKGSNPHHTKAIKNHGWSNVNVWTIKCPWYMLDTIEIFLIEYYDLTNPHKGYNKTTGGRKNWTHSKETRAKISERMSGEKAFWYGKTLSGETKKKLSEAHSGEKNPMYGKTGEKSHMYGKTLGEETKRKMSDAKYGEKHHASKKVYQYKLDGTYVNDFASSGEAARALGKTDGSSIRSCARRKQPTAYGFKWSHEKL